MPDTVPGILYSCNRYMAICQHHLHTSKLMVETGSLTVEQYKNEARQTLNKIANELLTTRYYLTLERGRHKQIFPSCDERESGTTTIKREIERKFLEIFSEAMDIIGTKEYSHFLYTNTIILP